jgi:hypothetical protein
MAQPVRTLRAFLRQPFSILMNSFGLIARLWRSRWRLTYPMAFNPWLKTWVRWIFVVGCLILFLRPGFDVLVNAMYRHTREPLDREMPVTVTSFNSSVDMVSAIGGQGAGLNCSLPWFVNHFFTSRPGEIATDAPVRQRFRQACVFHDLCYRHGLATYGYTQSECDDILLEQAIRVCLSAGDAPLTIVAKTRRPQLSECQLDAKKVLAALQRFGFKHFHAWGSSTYFEFDPTPYRSTRFYATRAVPHPFKSKAAAKEDPRDLLLRFSIVRGGVRFTCANCLKRRLSGDEFKLGGIAAIPKELKARWMNEEITTWLPIGRSYSAPHVIADGNGTLAWVLRENLENTHSCVAMADPKVLLTHTRPKAESCVGSASDRFVQGALDLNTTSPQLMVLPSTTSAPDTQPAILATGTTFQHGADLEFCISTNMRERGRPGSRCNVLVPSTRDTTASRKYQLDRLRRLEAFQNFPIVRNGYHIVLSRRIFPGDDGAKGTDHGRALALRVGPEHVPVKGQPNSENHVKVVDSAFRIPDEFDPMMALNLNGDKILLISARVHRTWGYTFGWSNGWLDLYEIDLRKNDPAPGKISLVHKNDKGSKVVGLHESWARRPILVMEADDKAGRTTELVLSRSAVTPLPEKQAEMQDKQDAEKKKAASDKSKSGVAPPKQPALDRVLFQFGIFRRPVTSGAGEPFELVGGLTCELSYVITVKHDRFNHCRRLAQEVGSDRATPATRMQGAQLLSGRFTKSGERSLALVDYCMVNDPAIVRPVGIAAKAALPRELANELKENAQMARTMKCSPIAAVDVLAKPLAAPDGGTSAGDQSQQFN